MEDKKTTTYVPPTIDTVDAEKVIAALGPAAAGGSGHNHHGGHSGGGSWGPHNW